METVRLLFKELFTIRFLHEGYGTGRANTISDSINIVPDRTTAAFLTNCNMGWRFNGDSFTCFTRSRRSAPEIYEPYIKSPGETTIRFLISGSTDFMAKTFAVNAGSKSVYQFSNRTNNAEDADPDILYLNREAELFSIAKDYQEGTIVKSGSILYAAVKTIKATHTILITDETYWKPFSAPIEVVNNKDLKTVAEAELEEKCFGVIDIHYTGTTDSYKLFNPSGQLLSPVYTLSFKSRI